MKPLVALADAFATAAHAAVKQTRKYDKEPYINHPRRVRENLLKYATWPVTLEMECAALLHDVVEDTGVTQELINEYFGDVVGVLVEELTDVSRLEDGNRKTRKQMDLDHTAAASVQGRTVKLSDLIDNCKSIVAHDPDFARVFLHEKSRILAVCQDADPGMLAEATRVLNESRAILAAMKTAAQDGTV